jgi:hypothetical protein
MVKMVARLAFLGANISCQDAESCTPMHRAAYRGQTAVVQRLVQLGADMEAWDSTRSTPMHRAAQTGHTDVRPPNPFAYRPPQQECAWCCFIPDGGGLERVAVGEAAGEHARQQERDGQGWIHAAASRGEPRPCGHGDHAGVHGAGPVRAGQRRRAAHAPRRRPGPPGGARRAALDGRHGEESE